MKNQLTKLDRIKIRVRKSFLQFAYKQIQDIELGDMDIEEYEVFRNELSDITDFISNKDKYMKAMEYYITHTRNKHINKYFKEGR